MVAFGMPILGMVFVIVRRGLRRRRARCIGPAIVIGWSGFRMAWPLLRRLVSVLFAVVLLGLLTLLGRFSTVCVAALSIPPLGIAARGVSPLIGDTLCFLGLVRCLFALTLGLALGLDLPLGCFGQIALACGFALRLNRALLCDPDGIAMQALLFERGRTPLLLLDALLFGAVLCSQLALDGEAPLASRIKLCLPGAGVVLLHRRQADPFLVADAQRMEGIQRPIAGTSGEHKETSKARGR